MFILWAADDIIISILLATTKVLRCGLRKKKSLEKIIQPIIIFAHDTIFLKYFFQQNELQMNNDQMQ